MYHISKDKRSKQTAEWIYYALEQLLEEWEYGKITIKQICLQAKIGRVSFYRHYDSIDDVLRKKCDDQFEGLAQHLMQVENSDDNRAFLKQFLGYWYEEQTFVKQLYAIGKFSIFQESVANFMHHANKRSDEIEENKQYFIAMRVAICSSMLYEWVKSDFLYTPEELARLILKWMLYFVNREQPI